MTPKFFSLDTVELTRIGVLTSYYSIGFLSISIENRIEEARSVGSGTLVTVGNLHGVLTAAHVVNELSRHREIGIVVGIGEPSKYQRQTFKMEYTDHIVMRGKSFDANGPDPRILTTSTGNR